MPKFVDEWPVRSPPAPPPESRYRIRESGGWYFCEEYAVDDKFWKWKHTGIATRNADTARRDMERIIESRRRGDRIIAKFNLDGEEL